jgi:hypothetical protein
MFRCDSCARRASIRLPAAVTEIDTQHVRRKPILNGLINEYTPATSGTEHLPVTRRILFSSGTKPAASSCGTPEPPRSVTSTRTRPSPALTATIPPAAPDGYAGHYCRKARSARPGDSQGNAKPGTSLPQPSARPRPANRPPHRRSGRVSQESVRFSCRGPQIGLRCTCDRPALYLARQPTLAIRAAAGRQGIGTVVHTRYMPGLSPGGEISRATTRTR